MKTTIVTFIGSVLIVTAACTKAPAPRAGRADRQDQRIALVRVVNTMPGGSAVDIFAGDQKIFSEVKPGAVVPYREVPRGMTTFRARWTGHDTERPIAENVETLRDKEFSTIVLLPSGSTGDSVDMSVFGDRVSAPSPGKAKVRVVHAIPGISGIDVYSQGKRLLNDVDFKDESRYVEMDPMTGELQFKRDDNYQIIATVPDLQLEVNRAYTILLAGLRDMAQTIVLEDRVEEPNLPAGYTPVVN